MGLQEPSASLKRAGLLIAVASLTSNVLQYAFLVGLSRVFSPELYGALGAVLGIGLVASIAAMAVQLVVARQAAQHVVVDTPLTLGAATGLGLLFAAATWVAAPLGSSLLHLDSTWPLFWLGVILLPQTLFGGIAGALQGQERFGRLGVAQVIWSLVRLLVLPLVAITGWGVSAAMAAIAVAAWLSALAGMALVGRTWPWRPWSRMPRTLLRELGRAASGIGGFAVLISLDLLLARHFLSPEDSGLYAVASLFSKAGLWGTQFVATVAYPRLARDEGERVLRLAALVVGLIGLAGAALATIIGRLLVEGLSGEAYLGVAPYAGWFVLLGTLMALVHLRLVAGIARDVGFYRRLIWATVALETTVVALLPHRSVPAIAAVAIGACVALVVIGYAKLNSHSASAKLARERV